VPHETPTPRGPDRRKKPTPVLSRHWLRGRRRGGRREGETEDIYVDRPSRREWLLFAAILGLAGLDGVWTLLHLERGVEEANPLMAWFLEVGGNPAFAAAKFGVTVVAAGFLLLHARFRTARRLMPWVVAVYTALVIVHAATEWSLRASP
jgi:hypothetical protein